jgi:hypothetical protein
VVKKLATFETSIDAFFVEKEVFPNSKTYVDWLKKKSLSKVVV